MVNPRRRGVNVAQELPLPYERRMGAGKLTSASNGENRIVFAKCLSDAVEEVLLRMEIGE
jgi:hypothetical protein